MGDPVRLMGRVGASVLGVENFQRFVFLPDWLNFKSPIVIWKTNKQKR